MSTVEGKRFEYEPKAYQVKYSASDEPFDYIHAEFDNCVEAFEWLAIRLEGAETPPAGVSFIVEFRGAIFETFPPLPPRDKTPLLCNFEVY